MKKFLFVMLALILAGCSTAAPTQPPAAQPTVELPTATPQVVVQTVVVTVVPTQAPTEIPTSTPLPPPTAIPPTPEPPIVVTVVVAPTQQAAPPPADIAAPSSAGPIAIDDTLGGGVFAKMSRSTDKFTLRCAPLDITFNVTAINPAIVNVELWYRIEDRTSTVDNITGWKNRGKMDTDRNGNFSLTFLGSDVHPDLRKSSSWFDFQFIGLAKSGDVVGRSEKISQTVDYSIDCK